MVVRRAKKNRKFLGTRRWGVGNIKNARGAGSRGGVGGLARLRKHDWTYYTAKAPELIRKKGFAPWRRSRLRSISLREVSSMLKAQGAPGSRAELELKGYKVLSNGALEGAAVIKADAFSKAATEKIKRAGGQAVVLSAHAEGTAAAKDAPAAQ